MKISDLFQAEARLAARRQARYEARNIRMKEIEKKQKEEEENQANHTNHNHVPHPHPLHPGKNLHFFREIIFTEFVNKQLTKCKISRLRKLPEKIKKYLKRM